MKQNWDLIVLLSFLVVLVIASMFAGWKLYDINKTLDEPVKTDDPYLAYATGIVNKNNPDKIDSWLRKEQENVKTVMTMVAQLKKQRIQLERDIAASRQRGDMYRSAAEDAMARGDRYLEAKNDIEKLAQAGVDLDKQLKDKTEIARRKLQEIINSEKDANSKEMDSLQQSLRSWEAREASHLADFDTRSKKHAANFSNLSRTLQAEESKLAVLTKQSEKEIDLKADGKVIFSDPNARTVNISLGRNEKMVPGMRFEVYTERMGFKRVRKGFIEVIRVFQTYSECLVIRTPISLPTDPFSEYVADSPEFQFSPYSSRGGAASPLTGVPLEKIWTVDTFEPIVIGDMINNPFYNRTRPLTFVFIGSTKIYYDKKDIAKSIELHGGTVVGQMSPEVDYVLAQAFQGPPTALTDAVQQGANIMYEWELFPFLRSR